MAILSNAIEWNKRRIETRRKKFSEKQTMNLCVIGIMKNEAFNIVEWIEHYLWQGADHIYLIDNGSTDDTIKKAQPYVDRGTVTIVERLARWKQRDHYWAVIEKFKIRTKAKWLLAADLDEFWFGKDGRTINAILQLPRYNSREFGADLIYVNWTLFGTSGYDKHPPSLREHLVHRKEGTVSATKWVCRPNKITRREDLDLHRIAGIDSRRVVSEQDIIQVNHYVTQSREFFETVKMTRGSASSRNNENVRDWEYFDKYDAPCTQRETLLADMVKNQSEQ